MNTLVIDPKLSAPLSECVDGEVETFLVTGTFHRKPDGSVLIDVAEVSKEDGYESEDDMADPLPPGVAILTGRKGKS